jgi:hypothetical protein
MGDFIEDGTNPNFTAGVLRPAAWTAAGSPDPTWQAAHQLIPGMLLTHALRNSGFGQQ